MLFMVPAAVKAKRLNTCPGETNCSSAWHNELGTTFRDIFLSAQMLHVEPRSRTHCAQSNRQWTPKTFGIFCDSMLSSVVWGLLAKAATCLLFSFIHRPESFLSAFLLSTTFSARFIPRFIHRTFLPSVSAFWLHR